MAKLYIELPDKEFVLLAENANNSCRSPRDQARWLIRQALLQECDKDRMPAQQVPATEQMSLA